MLYPESFEQKIDFSSIRSLLKEKCISSLGKEKVDFIRFSTDYVLIKKLLSQTDEMLRLLKYNDETLPVGDFYDIREGLLRIRVEGLFLDENEVFDLRRVLEAVKRVVDYVRKQDKAHFPELHSMLEDVRLFPEIISRIDRILDKFGRVKDNASPELARIRKEFTVVQASVSRVLHSILRQAQTDGYVEKDVMPTLRDGRLVIPVSPAFKRKISGIVHDESATGKTIFIEPSQVVETNNRLRELEGEERREIVRILTEFTHFLRPFTDDLQQSQHFLGEIDLVRAKALWAIQLNAIKPQLDDVCQLDWRRAIHPLLYLNLLKQGKSVVPLDIELNESQRILLISGPNAGGKSVCLKTVVLLQFMLQSGLLIPVHEQSRCGVFHRLFIDIGDEQSIENDLSTYSSHLTNMKFFIRNSNDKTLLLIDEFGTGTEPLIGGALAEATLARFNRQKAFGVITTHYTNLKLFAEATEGIVNGAMLYDRQHLQPLFQLQIGNPGSSFAVEIARKIGLPEELIADAAEKVGTEHLDYDKHLQDIVRDKRYWENKRQQIRLKEKKLEALIEKYQSEMSDIKRHRKEVIAKAREDAQQLMSDANARIEHTIRSIKEAQADKEKTKIIRKELLAFKDTVLETLKEERTSKHTPVAASKSNEVTSDAIQPGAWVKIKNQSTFGQVMEIQGKNAIVAFGLLKSSVKLSTLEVSSNTQQKKESKIKFSVKDTITDEVRQRKLHFKAEIDVRGMRGDETLQAVTYFIDDALIVGVSSVRILHGTGTGILRQLIRQYLSTVPGVRHYRDEHIQLGGAGITVVEF